MKLLTFPEIKQLIDSFPLTPELKDRNDIRGVAEQLGYTVPNCACKDKFGDLVVKLKLWLRQHPDGFPHYAMKAGVVRKGSKGTNIYNLNLTDEEAIWLLENDPEAKNYLTKIVPLENDSTELTTNKTDEQEKELVEGEQTKKSKRKMSTKVKK